MTFARMWRCLLALSILLLMAGCLGNDPTPTPVSAPVATQEATPTAVEAPPASPAAPSVGGTTVYAASSLKDAFDAMESGLAGQGVTSINYNYAGSQALAAQLAQGAQGGVFASADARTMQTAIDGGAVVSGTQQVFATNKMVVILPPPAETKATQQPIKVKTLADLAAPGLKLVLADPSVPAGNYSLQVLDKLSADAAYGSGFKDKVLANVVSRENSVREVVAKVQLSQAEAGIVYFTDARATVKPIMGDNNRPQFLPVRTLIIPDQFNVVAHYYIAPLKNAQNLEAVHRFINFVLTGPGQDTLESFGFGRADAK